MLAVPSMGLRCGRSEEAEDQEARGREPGGAGGGDTGDAGKAATVPSEGQLHTGRMHNEAYEAALRIKDAFDLVTRAVGYRPLDLGRIGVGHGECGARASLLIAIYVAWGNEMIRRYHVRPHVVVEWIDMERHLGRDAEPILIKACDLWIKAVADYSRAQRGGDILAA